MSQDTKIWVQVLDSGLIQLKAGLVQSPEILTAAPLQASTLGSTSPRPLLLEPCMLAPCMPRPYGTGPADPRPRDEPLSPKGFVRLLYIWTWTRSRERGRHRHNRLDTFLLQLQV